MSSPSILVESLELILTHLFRIGGPILIVLGTVSCILSLMVFGKKTLRKNPCSVFLMAFNASNLLYIYTSLLPGVLLTGYSIHINSVHTVVCRLLMYNALVVDVLSPFYLVGASIDRCLITSTQARIRQLSTLKSACISISVITLFWLIFHVYALILTDIVPITPEFWICYYSSNTVIGLIGYYSLTIKGIVIPCLMGISGLLTVQHIRGSRRITFVRDSTANCPSRTNNQRTSIHHRNRQFILITLANIGIYFLCNLMIISNAMYNQITRDELKSSDRIRIEYVIRMFSAFISALSFCTNCFSNLLVSKTFRHEFKSIF